MAEATDYPRIIDPLRAGILGGDMWRESDGLTATRRETCSSTDHEVEYSIKGWGSEIMRMALSPSKWTSEERDALYAAAIAG